MPQPKCKNSLIFWRTAHGVCLLLWVCRHPLRGVSWDLESLLETRTLSLIAELSNKTGKGIRLRGRLWMRQVYPASGFTNTAHRDNCKHAEGPQRGQGRNQNVGQVCNLSGQDTILSYGFAHGAQT